MQNFIKTLVIPLVMGVGAVFSTRPALAIEYIEQVDSGFYRGSTPKTREDFEELKSLGIQFVINLDQRPLAAKRERRLARKMGLTLLERPISALKVPKVQEVVSLLGLVNQHRSQGVYLHCNRGKDRTGMLVALYRVHRLEWQPKVAYQAWVQSGYWTWLRSLRKFYWRHITPGSLG